MQHASVQIAWDSPQRSKTQSHSDHNSFLQASKTPNIAHCSLRMNLKNMKSMK